ncbi:ribokinase [Streptacidiphilus albus]|uniref:ribokinase n=1 Tax=Streptacidiphilus albus TaxID=105425 RepID=UPI00054B8985|nr:ribokinase [Streptacidiphilus albus]
MSTQLAVVGSLNMDLSVRVRRLPTPGETVSGEDAVRDAGGKGANQAVAASRLGARVRMVGLLGDDAFGTELRARLVSEGVDDRAVGTLPDSSSGVALIVVQHDGENAITLSPGANRRLDAPVLERITGGDLLGPADVLLLQLEIPVATALAAARTARRAGVLTVLNAAPLPTVDDELLELLRSVDVLVVNQSEALGLLPDAGRPEAGPDCAAALLGLGPTVAVVTLGEAGAAAAEGLEALVEPGFRVDAVDAVGAGDAFCAQLALALGARVGLPEALRRACAAGALATTRAGAQAALPTSAEVDALLARTGGGVHAR